VSIPGEVVSKERVEERILTIRGVRVVIDRDLAKLYGVTTRVLNQAAKRNIERFPEDFRFQLTQKERSEVITKCDHLADLRFSPSLPYAFTEHGAIMAASVLNSEQAIALSIFVVRAFVKLREYAYTTQALEARLTELEQRVTDHDSHIQEIVQAIRQLMLPPMPTSKRRMGF